MNLIKATLTSLTLATAFFMSGAQASVIDTVTSTPNVKIGNDDVVTFTHNFSDEGFVIGKTTYLDAILSVRLTDKAAGEGGFITIGTQTKNISDVTDKTQDTTGGDYYTITLNAANLADLNKDGIISFSITGTSGDFYFAGSTITADAAAPVPEPASLALLGLGMLGLGAARRRRAGK
jgi:hypothetical protein